MWCVTIAMELRKVHTVHCRLCSTVPGVVCINCTVENYVLQCTVQWLVCINCTLCSPDYTLSRRASRFTNQHQNETKLGEIENPKKNPFLSSVLIKQGTDWTEKIISDKILSKYSLVGVFYSPEMIDKQMYDWSMVSSKTKCLTSEVPLLKENCTAQCLA